MADNQAQRKVELLLTPAEEKFVRLTLETLRLYTTEVRADYPPLTPQEREVYERMKKMIPGRKL